MRLRPPPMQAIFRPFYGRFASYLQINLLYGVRWPAGRKRERTPRVRADRISLDKRDQFFDYLRRRQLLRRDAQEFSALRRGGRAVLCTALEIQAATYQVVSSHREWSNITSG
jgi:hypothetical protein